MPIDSSDAAEFAAIPERLGSPPLRIHHFLMATAVTAGLLGLAKTVIDDDQLGMAGYLGSGTGILQTISASIAITAVGYGIAWRCAGRAFFHQPGHWLLVMRTFGAAPVLLFGLTYIAQYMGEKNLPNAFAAVYAIGMSVCWTALNALAAWKGADSRWWRTYFITQALLYVLVPLMVGTGSILVFIILYSGILILLMTAAIVADRRARRGRDWPHWLGVALVASGLLVAVISQIIAMFVL